MLFEGEVAGSKCFKFGSAATGLFLPKADIDMVIIHKDLKSPELFKRAKKVVKERPDRFIHVEYIENARVPLIKFAHAPSGFEFDVCFNEDGGLHAVSEIQAALRRYPEIRPLFLVLKLFLRQRRMHETFTGGLGSFLLFCMLLHFLRDFKARLVRNLGTYAVQNLTLSLLLMQFLFYYGVTFQYSEFEIDLCGDKPVRRKKSADNTFSFVSPNDPALNLGAGCFKFFDIVRVFKNRYNFLANFEHFPGESMLVHLINPSRTAFDRLGSH